MKIKFKLKSSRKKMYSKYFICCNRSIWKEYKCTSNCKEHNYFSPEAEWNRAVSAYITFDMNYLHKIQVGFWKLNFILVYRKFPNEFYISFVLLKWPKKPWELSKLVGHVVQLPLAVGTNRCFTDISKTHFLLKSGWRGWEWMEHGGHGQNPKPERTLKRSLSPQ